MTSRAVALTATLLLSLAVTVAPAPAAVSAANTAADVERDLTLTGTLEIDHTDDFERGVSSERDMLVVGTQRLPLIGLPSAQRINGARVVVTGRRSGSEFVVRTADV